MSVIDTSIVVVSAPEAADYIVEIDGDIGSRTATRFRDTLRHALEGNPVRLIVDLNGARLVDRTGLAVLVGVNERAKVYGTRLILRGLSHSQEDLLAATGLDRVLAVIR